MFIVRVQMKSGALQVYNFKDNAPLADSVRKVAASAMKNKEVCEFADEVGRTANIHGEDIALVQMVDLARETLGNIAAGQLEKQIYERLGMAASPPGDGRFPPAPNGRVPMEALEEDPLPVRRMATFAT